MSMKETMTLKEAAEEALGLLQIIDPMHGITTQLRNAIASQPAEQPNDSDRHDALCDSHYAAGMKLGWNLCVAGKEVEFNEIVEARSRAACSVLKTPAEQPRGEPVDWHAPSHPGYFDAKPKPDRAAHAQCGCAECENLRCGRPDGPEQAVGDGVHVATVKLSSEEYEFGPVIEWHKPWSEIRSGMKLYTTPRQAVATPAELTDESLQTAFEYFRDQHERANPWTAFAAGWKAALTAQRQVRKDGGVVDGSGRRPNKRGEKFWFEAWARGQGFSVRPNVGALPHGGEYVTQDTSNAWEGWAGRAALASPSAGAVVPEDTHLLNAIFRNSWDLRCFDMPTGAGDADIGWKVIEHTAAHGEVEVAVAYEDDPRKAIREAMLAAAPEVPHA